MLKDALAKAKPKYHMPNSAVITQVLNPGIANSKRIDCMSAYFNSEALRELANGLATFIADSDGKLRLLVSPDLSPTEFGIGEESTESSLKAFGDVLDAAGSDELETLIQNHTKQCLAWLLSVGRLEVKIVIKKSGLFHPKQWHLIDGDDVAVLSGSANVTLAGLTTGVETYSLARTWLSKEAKEVWSEDQIFWDQYWDNLRDDAISVPVQEAYLKGFLDKYKGDSKPSEALFAKAIAEFRHFENDGSDTEEDFITITGKLTAPSSFIWETGEYAHQGEAVFAWEAAGRTGMLEMATGSGKTLTSLLAASRLAEKTPLFVVVAVPTKILLKQWVDDCRFFSVDPYVADEKKTQEEHLTSIKVLARQVAEGRSTQHVVIVTHDFIKNEHLTSFLSKSKYAPLTLLIADEVHRLSLPTFLSHAPEVQYKLGLSATPWKQFESVANTSLSKYFGDVVFSFPLEKAIGVCLVPYQYQARLVEATTDEVEYWKEQRAAFAAWLGTCSSPMTPAQRRQGAQKGKQMRKYIEAAELKIGALETDIRQIGIGNIKNTLIYCTSADPSQLEKVNALLSRLGIPFRQITQNETATPKKVREILREFRKGNLRVITSKKVLDEGFNIPQIDTAFFLASSTSTREWIQRRGRILRLAPNKVIARIYDYGVVAPSLDSAEKMKAFSSGDLLRVQEFFRLSDDPKEGLDQWIEYNLSTYPELEWPPTPFRPEDDLDDEIDDLGEEGTFNE